jgi:YgiT-type zinc finger domain-containing protein
MNGLETVLDVDKKTEQDVCPICGGQMIETVTYYSDWHNGKLLVVRDVPVRECQLDGHQFFRAKVARAIERLFETNNQLRPVKVMKVPVFELELA